MCEVINEHAIKVTEFCGSAAQRSGGQQDEARRCKVLRALQGTKCALKGTPDRVDTVETMQQSC